MVSIHIWLKNIFISFLLRSNRSVKANLTTAHVLIFCLFFHKEKRWWRCLHQSSATLKTHNRSNNAGINKVGDSWIRVEFSNKIWIHNDRLMTEIVRIPFIRYKIISQNFSTSMFNFHWNKWNDRMYFMSSPCRISNQAKVGRCWLQTKTIRLATTEE